MDLQLIQKGSYGDSMSKKEEIELAKIRVCLELIGDTLMTLTRLFTIQLEHQIAPHGWDKVEPIEWDEKYRERRVK